MIKNKKNLILIITILMVSIFSTNVFGEFDDFSAISINLVNQDPDPAVAGDIVEVRIGVSNQGGESANNLMMEIEPGYPFQSIPGESLIKEVGTINGYQGTYTDDVKIIKYKLRVDKDATAGDYDFDVKIFENGSFVTTTKSLSLEIDNKDSAEIVYIDQVELIPGKITPLKFTINNVGSTSLRDLTFHWENEGDIILPVGSDNTKYVQNIDVGESVELTFDVIASANADPDLYKLDLTLSYDTNNGESEINTKAGVYVGGATDFDVAFSGSSNSEYSFAISNIGSVSASSVTIKIPSQDSWKTSGSNSVIIGNLNEGDYTIASFNLVKNSQNKRPVVTDNSNVDVSSVQKNSESETPITLEIVYTDTRGNRNVVEKEVSIISSFDASNIENAASMPNSPRMKQNTDNTSSNYGTWILVGIAFVLIFVVRNKYKKEKMSKSNYTYTKAIKDLIKRK